MRPSAKQTPTLAQLKRAVALKKKISILEGRLAALLGNAAEAGETGDVKKKRKFSAAGIARIKAAQKKRWAKLKAAQKRSA
jgi:hypothetical protein